jgi:hypothetical protein
LHSPGRGRRTRSGSAGSSASRRGGLSVASRSTAPSTEDDAVVLLRPTTETLPYCTSRTRPSVAGAADPPSRHLPWYGSGDLTRSTGSGRSARPPSAHAARRGRSSLEGPPGPAAVDAPAAKESTDRRST